MSKNLYKAKDKYTKEWVFGNLFIGEDGECEILRGTKKVRISNEVDPETVCQYIGKTDKNGTKMFECDRIDISVDPEKHSFYTIRWSEEYCQYYISGDNGEDYDIIHRLAKQCRVIGNIHDKEV